LSPHVTKSRSPDLQITRSPDHQFDLFVLSKAREGETGGFLLRFLLARADAFGNHLPLDDHGDLKLLAMIGADRRGQALFR